jgi:hypothetical protein
MSKMSLARLAFIQFKRGVEPLYQQKSDNQNSEDEGMFKKKQDAFEHLCFALDRAFDSSQSQMFDYLKKETVTTKLARTEAAMNLLAENLTSVEPPGTGEKLIEEMASKLTCLVRYAVGPAHDTSKPGPTLTVSHE